MTRTPSEQNSKTTFEATLSIIANLKVYPLNGRQSRAVGQSKSLTSSRFFCILAADKASRWGAMSAEARAKRRAEAAAEFDQHENRSDGARVTNLLGDGLTVLRDSFFNRVHGDVEKEFGLDSMLLPVAVLKSEANTNLEIEIYQTVEAALALQENRYVASDGGWLMNWLARLRLAESAESPAVVQRMAFYAERSADDRRRSFLTRLQQVLPEAGRAPLVMFRLFPLAISIAVALAFGDHPRAEETRKRQVTWLPSIADCHSCHGRLLENGEKCQHCGNPFWKYDWLTAD
jgi:hypothetical protein